jgi:hypothetical protein
VFMLQALVSMEAFGAFSWQFVATNIILWWYWCYKSNIMNFSSKKNIMNFAWFWHTNKNRCCKHNKDVARVRVCQNGRTTLILNFRGFG